MKAVKSALFLLCFSLFFAGVAWGSHGTTEAERDGLYVPTEAWQQVASTGVNDADNEIVVSMQEFHNDLYAGTFNVVDGASLLRSPDGETWSAVETGGFTNPFNGAIYDFIEYDGSLYAATGNGVNQAELWTSQTGDNGTWQEVDNTGLGANQGAYWSLLTYQGMLWAGTSATGGTSAELWTYDSGTTNWTKQVIPAFNTSGTNAGILSMVEFGGDLYIGTSNGLSGAEVWRYDGSDSSWQRVAQNGFGTPANGIIYTMRVYNGQLYVGTVNNVTGAELYVTQDGNSWQQVFANGFDNPNNEAIWNLYEVNGYLYLATENSVDGGRLYRTTDGYSWTPINLGGFGDVNNTLIWGMFAFESVNGLDLYAGTSNLNGADIWRTAVPQPEESWELVESAGFDGDMNNDAILDYVEFEGALYAALANISGTQVWHSLDGRQWTQVGTDGFGDANNVGGYSLTVHDNELYLGTQNVNGGVVYRLSSNGAEWEAVNLPGFGDANNQAVFALASFNNSLYAGTFNVVDRAEVWRYTGTNWVNVSPPDMDFEADNDFIRSMVVYNGALYIGTYSPMGGELWHTSNGTTWEALQTDGQGDSDNDQLLVLHAFNGALYAGYSNAVTGGQVWRSADGQTGWTQVNQAGFGTNSVDDPSNRAVISMVEWRDFLYVGTQNMFTGGEIWRTTVGATQSDWEQVNTDGFSFEENRGIWALEVFEHQLYGGTSNVATGAEVWRTTRPDQGVNDPCCQVVKVGIELQGAGWIRVNGDTTTPIRAPQAGIYDVPLPGAGTYNITVEYVEGNQGVVQPITAQVDNNGDVQLTHEAIMPLANNRVPDEAWSLVADSAQIGPNDFTIVAMQQFDNYLYGSTINGGGASIVRSPDGKTWDPVVTGGFGDLSNTGIYDMVEYDSQLYAGTNRVVGAAELYRSATGDNGTWQEVDNTGLGAQQTGYWSLLPYNDPIVGHEILWAGTLSAGADSAELWYYDSNSSNWTRESIPGFDVDSNGDLAADNMGIYAIEAFQGDLYIGTGNNITGAEVWRRSGTDGSWAKIVQNGFTTPDNRIIYGSAVYNNVLYLGTVNNITGAELYATRDGETWELIFNNGFDDPANLAIWRLFDANGYLYLGTGNVNGGRVYRTVDGNAWSPVSLPGFGTANNSRIWGMSAFDDTNGDTYLYAGTTNTTTGAEIWRSIIPQPQESWQQVERDGIDDDLNNTAIWSVVEYDNAIYVGTQNSVDGAQVWRSQEGGTWVKLGLDGLDGSTNNMIIESLAVHNNDLYAGVRNLTNGGRVYRWDGSSGTWEQLNSDGFGDINNQGAVELHSFDGSLYASTFNAVDRAKIYRYTGTGTNWTNVSPPNADFEQSNFSVWAMIVVDNQLYIGTQNGSGGEIWRYNGSTWESITTDGFGDTNNQRVEAFAEFDGYLYASFGNFADGGELWRSQTGNSGTWQQVNQNGFGRNLVDDSDNDSITALAVWQGKLYAATSNPFTGNEVWASATGSTQAEWEQVNSDGFGYQANRAIRSALLGFGNHLYAGTQNFATGAELWRTGLPGTSGERFAEVVNVTLRTNQATTVNITGQSNQSIDIPARGLYKLALPATGLYDISADCGQTLQIALDAPIGPQLTSFTFNAIADQLVNDAFAITINALDENSNPIAITGNMSLSDSTGTLMPTQVSFNNQSSITIDGTIAITATDVVITGTYNDIIGTSNAFDVTAPPEEPELSSFTFNPIADQLVNDAFPITINALDENSNPIAITGNMTLSDSTGTLAPTMATFNNQSSTTLNVTIAITATDVTITGTYDVFISTSNLFDVTDSQTPEDYQIYLPIIMGP